MMAVTISVPVRMPVEDYTSVRIGVLNISTSHHNATLNKIQKTVVVR